MSNVESGINEDGTYEYQDGYQTQRRGTNSNEYQIYLACADDGQGGDITRNGAPLKTYDEWIGS